VADEDRELTRLELTLFYRLLAGEEGPRECERMHVDRHEMMERLLRLIVPPTCTADDIGSDTCTGESRGG
jgi:hypothetical protein